MKEDGAAKYEVQRIARRRAAPEVSLWENEPDFKKKFHSNDFALLKEQSAKEVKRKADEAINSIKGEDGHALCVDGVWHRCRDCNGMAHAKNQKYWARSPCARQVKRARPNPMEEGIRAPQQYRLAPEPEDLRIDSDSDEEAELATTSSEPFAISQHITTNLSISRCSRTCCSYTTQARR